MSTDVRNKEATTGFLPDFSALPKLCLIFFVHHSSNTAGERTPLTVMEFTPCTWILQTVMERPLLFYAIIILFVLNVSSFLWITTTETPSRPKTQVSGPELGAWCGSCYILVCVSWLCHSSWQFATTLTPLNSAGFLLPTVCEVGQEESQLRREGERSTKTVQYSK